MQTTNLRIEQVEMIRRLRNSGASLQQITEAYQVFDRLDSEFGSFGTVKVSQSIHHVPSSSNHTPACSPSNVQSSLMSQLPPDCDNDHIDRIRNAFSVHQNSTAQTPMQRKILSLLQNPSKVSQSREGLAAWSPDVANNTKSPLIRKGDGRHIRLNDNNTQSCDSSPDTTIRPANSDHCMSSSCRDDLLSWNLPVSEPQCLPSSSFLTTKQGASFTFDNRNGSGTNGFKTLPAIMTSETALREAGRCMLLSATPDEIVALIRKCSMSVGTFDPCQLSTVYGLSHAELSNVLSGHIPREGDRGLQVADWFVNTLIKTEWFINDILKYSQQITTPKQTEAVDMDFIPRRERFTFRDIHLEVMESHFKIDHYPSQKEKEMIANECNIKMAMASNSELTEKERATHINVDHWFRNKRKEMIRRAKMEKTDANRVTLPGHAKSPRKVIDSMSPESFPDKEGYYSTLTSAQPLHAFTSSQAIDLDKSSPANGESQASSPQTKDRYLPSQSQILNPGAGFDDKLTPELLQTTKEVSQAASSNVTKVDIKIEPQSEEEGHDSTT